MVTGLCIENEKIVLGKKGEVNRLGAYITMQSGRRVLGHVSLSLSLSLSVCGCVYV